MKDKTLIKVNYCNEKGKLIAIENYSDGSKRKVEIKKGIVDYILNGEPKKEKIKEIVTNGRLSKIGIKIDNKNKGKLIINAQNIQKKELKKAVKGIKKVLDKKQLSKTNKKEILKEKYKQEIEQKKTELNRYIETIVKYSFTEVCTSGAYFDDLFHKELFSAFDTIRNSKLSEEEKQKLHMSILFGERGKKQTEEEIHQLNIKHYDKLIWWAKHYLKDLTDEKKKEIITDCIEKTNAWDNQFDNTSKIRKEIEELEKNKKIN